MSGVKNADPKGKLAARVMRKKEKLARLKKQRPHLSVPVPEGLRKAWELKNRSKQYEKRKREVFERMMVHKRKKQAERIRSYDEKYLRLEAEKKGKILAARKEGNFFKPKDAHFAIVIRIRGINAISPKVRKVLEIFRLLQIHNAVFVKINKATTNMLKLIQPYVAFGYPSVDTVRKLIYKRGYAKIRHRPGSISRIPIMDNHLIFEHLGKYGMETLEDIVDQIVMAGTHFTQATNFLWPFKLHSPRGGYRGCKRNHYLEGGTYGNWEHKIDNLVLRMI
jgi:large subunit ribosomal protein L7e